MDTEYAPETEWLAFETASRICYIKFYPGLPDALHEISRTVHSGGFDELCKAHAIHLFLLTKT